jgi:hypothetical protein
MADLQGLSGLQSAADSTQDKFNQNQNVYSQQQAMTAQKALQTAKDKAISTKWYGAGKSTDPAEPHKAGVIETGMDIASAQMRAGEGAISYLLGKSPEYSSIGEAMYKNATERKEGYGDLLRKYDLPNYFSMPIGFALDVFLDPLNWETMGTAAFVPRLAVGAKAGIEGGEGILKGIGLAAKSGALEKASKVASAANWVSRGAVGQLESIAGKAVKQSATDVALQNLAKTEVPRVAGTGLWGITEKSVEDFNKFRGLGKGALETGTPEELMMSGAKKEGASIVGSARGPIVRQADNALSFLSDDSKAFLQQNPNLAGMVKFFEYNSDKWVAAKALENAVQKAKITGDPSDILKVAELLGDDAKASQLVKDGAEVATKALDPRQVPLAGTTEVDRLWQTSGDMKKQVTEEFLAKAKAKMKEDGYSDMIINARMKIKENHPWLEAAIQNYQTFVIAPFKASKTVFNPASYTFQAVGNPLMAKAQGLNIGANYYSAVNEARNVLNGKGSAWEFFKKYFIGNPKFFDWMSDEANAMAFKQSFGTTPNEFIFRAGVDLALQKGGPGAMAELQALPAAEVPEVMKERLAEWMAAVFRKQKMGVATTWAERMMGSKDVNMTDMLDHVLSKIRSYDVESPFAMAIKEAKARGKNITDVAKEYGSGLVTEELHGSGMGRIMSTLGTLSKDPDASAFTRKLAGGAEALISKWGDAYGRIDQSFKLGTMMHMVNNGVSEGELRMLSRFHKIAENDLIGAVTREGIKYYQITPDLAMKISNDIYMNYQAMPAFVRIMRDLPLVGTPFASFSYAMLMDKLPSTVKNNPAFFSKLQSAMQEMAGGETPIEGKMKEKSAYAKLQSLGQQRLGFLPFFKNNPMYLKIGSAVPFLSINQLDPSERTWGEGLKGKAMGAVDTFLLNDPIGQILKDYFLPAITMAETEDTTVGRMGQKILPVNPTLTQRLGYATRALGEASPLGTPALGILGSPFAAALSDEALQNVPNWQLRNISESLKGKNALGISRQEDPKLQFLRSLSKALGADLTNVPLEQYKETPNK